MCDWVAQASKEGKKEYITLVLSNNCCNIFFYSEWPILHRLNHLTDVIYNLYSDVTGEFRLWSSRFRRFRTSNGNILRVVWICFDADQFSVIVYDNNCTRSLLLAEKLFQVHRHVERDNDDISEALEVLVGVEAESDGVADVEWFDDAIEELQKELVERRLGNLGRVMAHENDNFQLSLAPEELVEEVAKTGYGQKRLGLWRAFENIIVTKLSRSHIIFYHIDNDKCVSWCKWY